LELAASKKRKLKISGPPIQLEEEELDPRIAPFLQLVSRVRSSMHFLRSQLKN